MVDAVMRLTGATPTEKMVLVSLAENCRKGSPLASPGMDDDAAGHGDQVGMLTRTGLSRTTIVNTTKRLADLDRPGGPLLHNEQRGGWRRRGVWRLLLTPTQRSTTTTASDDSQRSTTTTASDDSQRSITPSVAVNSKDRSGQRGRPPLGFKLSENLSLSRATTTSGAASRSTDPARSEDETEGFASYLAMYGHSYDIKDVRSTVGIIRKAKPDADYDTVEDVLVQIAGHKPDRLAAYAVGMGDDLGELKLRTADDLLDALGQQCMHGWPTRDSSACPYCAADGTSST
jgi:hypothetical protein